MSKAKNSLEDVYHHPHIFVPRLTLEARMRRSHLGRERERLIHGKGRKVNVVLVAVYGVSPVVFLNIGGRE